MGHPRYRGEEVCRRGREIYKSSIRAHIDEQANRGKPLIIDIETGDYEMGQTAWRSQIACWRNIPEPLCTVCASASPPLRK